MGFEDYWKLLIAKNPKLSLDVIKVKQTGLKAMLKQSYEYGKDTRSIKTAETQDCEVVDRLKNMFGM